MLFPTSEVCRIIEARSLSKLAAVAFHSVYANHTIRSILYEVKLPDGYPSTFTGLLIIRCNIDIFVKSSVTSKLFEPKSLSGVNVIVEVTLSDQWWYDLSFGIN